MKLLKFFTILFCVYITLNSAEKTLQNGLDGYEGCIDSYITEEGKTGAFNHGSEQSIVVEGGT